MANSSGSLISVLENAMNTRCRQHNYCFAFERIKYCIDLNDKTPGVTPSIIDEGHRKVLKLALYENNR